MLDAYKLATMPKAAVLPIKDPGRNATCAINGCPLDQHTYYVVLPGGYRACPGCAVDHGWTVQ